MRIAALYPEKPAPLSPEVCMYQYSRSITCDLFIFIHVHMYLYIYGSTRDIQT